MNGTALHEHVTRKDDKVKRITICLLLLIPQTLFASDTMKTRFEVESLFPMFFYHGSHLALGIREHNIRFRVSCIDGGDYDYEPNNDQFERNLGSGCGVFAGYFLNSHWHTYLFLEKQSYIVTKRDTNIKETFNVLDFGPGIGYQYFFSKNFYIQPAVHLYWRKSQEKTIDGIHYKLRNFDFSPVIRAGYQF